VSSAATVERLTQIWETPKTTWGWFSTVDHKKVGKRYLVTAFLFLVIGGIEALIMRVQLARAIKDPDLPVYSGVLATGGDVVSYGTMEGWFRAVDAKTGQILWQFKCASGIVANPITYVGSDGKQYIAIYSGVGGWMGATAFPTVSTDDEYAALGVVGAMKKIKDKTAPGDVLYVFGL
jgi:glucose dehydrogenase